MLDIWGEADALLNAPPTPRGASASVWDEADALLSVPAAPRARTSFTSAPPALGTATGSGAFSPLELETIQRSPATQVFQPPAIRPPQKVEAPPGWITPSLMPAADIGLTIPMEGAKQAISGVAALATKVAAPFRADVATGRPVGALHPLAVDDATLDAASDVLQGTMAAASPAVLVGLVTAPVTSLISLGAFWVAGSGAEKLTQMAGGNPSQQRFAKAITEAVVALGGAKKVVDTIRQIPDAAKAAARPLVVAAKLSGSGYGTGDVPGFRGTGYGETEGSGRPAVALIKELIDFQRGPSEAALPSGPRAPRTPSPARETDNIIGPSGGRLAPVQPATPAAISEAGRPAGRIPSPASVLPPLEQVRLVATGTKPAAILNLPLAADTTRALRENKQLFLLETPETQDSETKTFTPGRVLIAKTPEALDRLQQVLTATPDHTEVGRALGYPEADIAAYVARYGPGGQPAPVAPESRVALAQVNDYFGKLATQIKEAGYDPRAAQTAIAQARETFAEQPELLAQVNDVATRIEADPTAIKPLVDTLIAQSGEGQPTDVTGRRLGGFAGPQRRVADLGPPRDVPERRLLPMAHVKQDVRDSAVWKAADALLATPAPVAVVPPASSTRRPVSPVLPPTVEAETVSQAGPVGREPVGSMLTKQPWQMTRAEFAVSENAQRVQAIQSAITNRDSRFDDPRDHLQDGSVSLVFGADWNYLAIPPSEDINKFGEQQPRLPEAGAVREQEQPTPQFEAPFSLSREADQTARARDRDLFAGAPPRSGGAGSSGTRSFAGLRPMPSMPSTVGALGKQLRPSEIVTLLSKSLDELPIRIGRFRQRALGIYKERPQVIRLKVANDLQVLAHEIGHHIDKTLIGFENPQVNPELERLGASTSKPSYTKGQIRDEGAAEFLRLYLSDPGRIAAIAPNYLHAFDRALDGQPELKATLLHARQQYQGYLSLDPKDRLLAHVDFKGTDSPGGAKTDWFTKLQTAWVDDLTPLRQAVAAMAEGKPVDVTASAYTLARLARGVPAKADGFLRFGPRGANGQRLAGSFEAALEPVKDRIKDFAAYVIASRVVELKGRRGLETGIDLADAKAVLSALESPLFQKSRQLLYAYQDGVLEYAHQGGVLSSTQVKQIRDANQFYVPFRRIQEALDGYLQGGGAARRMANRANPIKRYKGSGVDLINPLESVLRNTHAIVDMVEKNRALVALVTQADATLGAGKWIERVPPPQEVTRVHMTDMTRAMGQALEDAGLTVERVLGPDGPQLEVEGSVIDLDQIVNVFSPAQFVKGERGLITIVRDGKRDFYQVNNIALYDAISAVGVQSSDLLMNLFMKPARLLRAGATLTVGFLARNPLRDTFTAAVNSRYGFRPGYDTLRGLFTYLKKDEDYQLFLNSGAGNSAMLGPDRNRIREELHRMGLDGRHRWLNTVVLNPINLLRALSEAGENATRLGEFKLGLGIEGRTPEGVARAGLAARDVTVDFGRAGSVSREINRYKAFFNATVQGTVRIGEVFSGADVAGLPKVGSGAGGPGPARIPTAQGASPTTRALGATWRALAAIMLPTLALWYLNRDDPEYRELPAWEKLTYWHIPLGKGKGFARVPTPFELFTVFGAVPLAAMDYLYAKDPAVADQLFPNSDSAWSLLVSTMPTAILPAVEVVTNYDTFRKRPVVSPWDLQLEKELQSNRWTSALAKDVGPKIGLAPAKFDHLVYGYLAGLGRTAIGTIDLARGKQAERAGTSVRQWPLIGDPVNAFSRPYAGADAQSIQELYTARDAIAGARASANIYLNRGEIAKAREVYGALSARYGNIAARVQSVNVSIEALSTLRAGLDRLWADPQQSPEHKQERQDHLLEQMVNTARIGLGKPLLPSRFAVPESQAPSIGATR